MELRRCWWKSPTLKGTVSWHNGWMSPPSVLPPWPVYLPFSSWGPAQGFFLLMWGLSCYHCLLEGLGPGCLCSTWRPYPWLHAQSSATCWLGVFLHVCVWTFKAIQFKRWLVCALLEGFPLIWGKNCTVFFFSNIQGCRGSKVGIWHFLLSLQSSCIIYDCALNSLAQGSSICKQIRPFRHSEPVV